MSTPQSAHSKLRTDSFVFDPRPNYPLLITVNRYTIASRPAPAYDENDDDEITLIVAHGTGFHKEQWEPTLEELFDVLEDSEKQGGTKIKVKEAWAIDMPNHGDGGVLNEHRLLQGHDELFSWEEYGRALHLVLTHTVQPCRGLPAGLNLMRRRLVGVGHSMGAVGLTLSTQYQPLVSNIRAFIFAELMLTSHESNGAEGPLTKTLVGGASKRRDVWGSRQEAFEALRSREAFKIWDERVLRAFTEKGLRDLPTLEYPDPNVKGVTLKCTRHQEAITYLDFAGRHHAYDLLKTLVRQLPMHLIYGAIDDYIPPKEKNSVINIATGGKDRLASLVRVEGSGHLIVQRQPRGLARAVYNALVHPLTLNSRGMRTQVEVLAEMEQEGVIPGGMDPKILAEQVSGRPQKGLGREDKKDKKQPPQSKL